MHVCVCARVHSIKATVAHPSDVLGAVVACWMMLVLAVCSLYMSHSNFSFYKSWMQINNPDRISWICYLVRQKTHKPGCNIHTLTIIACVYLFMSDPEWIGSFCVVDSFKRIAGSGCHIQTSKRSPGPTGQHWRARPHHRLHHHLVRGKTACVLVR